MALKINYGFVPLPRIILSLCLDLTKNEFRFLAYLIDTAIRLGKWTDIRLTDEEIMNGRKYKDRSRADNGSGLKRIGLREARQRLIERGWISYSLDEKDKARPIKHYSVNITHFQEEQSHLELSEENHQVGDGNHNPSDGNHRQNTDGNHQGNVWKPSGRVMETISRTDTKGTTLDSTSLNKKEEKEYNIADLKKSEPPEENLPVQSSDQNALFPGEEPPPEPTVDWNREVDSFVELYNVEAVTVGWAECVKVTPARRKNLTNLLKDWPDWQDWVEMFQKLRHSPWLCGEIEGRNGPFSKAHRCIDWLYGKDRAGVSNFLKIYEGKYTPDPKPRPRFVYEDAPADHPLMQDPV